jgi:hypothetical protein
MTFAFDPSRFFERLSMVEAAAHLQAELSKRAPKRPLTVVRAFENYFTTAYD